MAKRTQYEDSAVDSEEGVFVSARLQIAIDNLVRVVKTEIKENSTFNNSTRAELDKMNAKLRDERVKNEAENKRLTDGWASLLDSKLIVSKEFTKLKVEREELASWAGRLTAWSRELGAEDERQTTLRNTESATEAVNPHGKSICNFILQCI
jgi:hypothetical protein